MRERLFGVALLLPFVLVSCESDTTAIKSDVINFSTTDDLWGGDTRTSVLELAGLKGQGFRVSAYSTGAVDWTSAKDQATPAFMYNRLVQWDNSTWTYADVERWPGKANNDRFSKVSFFAWNEGTGAIVSASSTTGAPTLTYTVPNAHTDQKDLAVDVLTDRTNETEESRNVQFAFSHVLSCIGFKAHLDKRYPDKVIKVVSLKVKYKPNAVESKATYRFGDVDHAGGVWEFPAASKDKAYMSHTTGDEVAPAAGVELDNSETPQFTRLNADNAYLMLLPQATAAGDIRIEVAWTADGVSQNETFDLQAHDWLPGKRYDYSMTVSPPEITLDEITVNPWDEGTYKPCIMTYEANNGLNSKLIYERGLGMSFPLPSADAFSKSGYIFDGWNTKAGGDGTAYQPGEPFLCTGDATLYAQWLPGINLTNGDYASGMVSYNNELFTITTSGSYIITGTSSNGNCIKVASGITAAIRLKDAVIDVSEYYACAFDMEGANVILTLQGNNILKSGSNYAGLHVPAGAVIQINSISGAGSNDGILTVTGGNWDSDNGYGAGIGGRGGGYSAKKSDGSCGEAGGTVYINGGTVNAASGNNNAYAFRIGGTGAGIGGGGGASDNKSFGGAGGTVYINGGTVNATSGNNNHGGTGAGIGGGGGGGNTQRGKGDEDDGVGGAGGTVFISGGTVNATSGNSNNGGIGAGIGGGGGGGYIGKSGSFRHNSGNKAMYVGPGEPEQYGLNYTGSKGAAHVTVKVGSGTWGATAIGPGGFGSYSLDYY